MTSKSKPEIYAVHVFEDGRQEWYLHGKLHRTNGPARCWPDGEEHWYYRGKLHREDGPAIVRPETQTQCWFYLGHPVICSNQEEFEELLHLKFAW